MATKVPTPAINAAHLKLIGAALSVLFAAAGASYTAYDSITTYIEGLATKEELNYRVRSEINTLSIDLVKSSVRSYEDDLVSIEFKIANGTATAVDNANKKNIERRLDELRDRLNRLEDEAKKLQPISYTDE
jgi:F0F1-type ATP synthase membrane subunit c/vacuolar-type H+-ATPase subunit K